MHPRRTTYFDAAMSGPAPGEAGIGFVVFDADGSVLHEHSAYIGRATVPEAEYRACIAALTYVRDRRYPYMTFYGDAELIVRHLQGVYAVRAHNLRPLYAAAQALFAQIPYSFIQWVPRRQNKHADILSRRELDAELARRRTALGEVT